MPKHKNSKQKSSNDSLQNSSINSIVDEIRQNYVSGTHPISWGGLSQVKKYYPSQSLQSIKEALAGVDTYTLQRNVKRPRNFNPIFVREPRELMQCDLISFARTDQLYAKANDNFIYLLVLIDSFTRFVWIKPLQNKQAPTILKAFSTLQNEMRNGFGRQLLCDQGGEFQNALVKKWLKEQKIELIIPNGKAPTVERFNQTFQNMLFRYMDYHSTRRYIDVIDKFLKLYNYSKHHRIIGMTPSEAEKPENLEKVVQNLEKYYKSAVGNKTHKKPQFKVGDLVRVSRQKNIFEKGYHRNFQPEVYKIREVLTHMPIPMYRLAFDSNGKNEEGTWYGDELQLVKPNYTDGLVYKVNVEKTRHRKGYPKEHFINYTYWPSKYGHWQWADQISDYQTEAQQYAKN